MSLASRISSLATRVGQEVKALWTAVNGKANADHNHNAAYLALTGGTVTDTVIISKTGDGAELLRLAIENYWSIMQSGTGSGSNLVLKASSDGKAFIIRSENGTKEIAFYPYNSGAVMAIDGHAVWNAGNFNPLSKEDAFSKNSAFNKNFGNSAGAVCEGNDSRLSDARTPTDSSVTYAKVASSLTGRATYTSGSIDFSTNGILDAAFSSNKGTLSFSNLQANKVLKMKLVITNSATFSLPAGFTLLDGSVAASGTNGTYFLYFDCWSTSPEVLVTITKAAS